MSKSKGTEKTTQETKLPDWLNQYAQDYMSQASLASQNLMGPYQGQQVANMTPLQQQMISRMGQLANFELTPDAISGMMNPYIKDVEQASLAQGQRALSQNLNQISDAGIRAGGAFGSRQGVLEGVASAENAMNQANLSANLRQQGYQNAIQNLIAGNQASMQAAQAGYGAGAAQQQQAQNQINAAIEQYNALRGFPLEQLNIMGSALGTVPYGQTTVQRTPTSGSPLSGALGGAFMGAQLGSSIPGIGTGLGAIGGGLLGAFS